MVQTEESGTLFGEVEKVERRRRKKGEQVFKRYEQKQMMLLPPSLEELIPEKHLVRVVNSTIEGMKIDALLSTYEGGGTSAYHPLMMLKVLVYAYVSKIYSSRKIGKGLREDVNFMWLSGMNRPDFRTINRFRSGRLKGVIDEVFGTMTVFLVEHGYVGLEEYFVDGTKMGADNNKHKVVWKKNTKRYKQKVQEKIKGLLKEIEKVNEEENERYGDRDLEELGEETDLTSEDVKEQIKKINEIIRKVPKVKKAKKAVREIETKLAPKLEKYEEQEKTLAGRNSYAKTDTDATVFMMKDGQLLPAYNVIIGTQSQFILNFSFNQRKASESDALIEHLRHGKEIMGRYPSVVVGDSAYGSEENYAFLEEKKMDNYLKYNTFHIEKTNKYRNNPYRKENFAYDQESDTYRCPQGRSVSFKETREVKTDNGYTTELRIYQCTDCTDCSVRKLCKRGDGNRTIQINRKLEAYRSQARVNLESEKGIALRKERGVDVEPVFADIKLNQNYRRFRLRGQEKVNVEMGLLSMAHNTKKIARLIN
ncbi:MAG TPA: IS1182 family transposase [Candidatus Kryptobacter bacterium]|nr:IS1182 family transposase [Candidatus Kryptobacter bacterium]